MSPRPRIPWSRRRSASAPMPTGRTGNSILLTRRPAVGSKLAMQESIRVWRRLHAGRKRRAPAGAALVLGATVLWSLAGYFARLIAHLDLGTVLCGRAGFGALCISAWAVLEQRRGVLGPRFGFGPLSPLIVAALRHRHLVLYRGGDDHDGRRRPRHLRHHAFRRRRHGLRHQRRAGLAPHADRRRGRDGRRRHHGRERPRLRPPRSARPCRS